MAERIRREHELLTLRLSLDIGRATLVQLEMFRGSRKLDEHACPAHALGVYGRIEYKDYQRRVFVLPDSMEVWLVQAIRTHMNLNEPLWLELRHRQLAIVPWEEWLIRLSNAPIVRIPNFAVAPRFISGDLLRLAVCASAPSAKSPYPVAPYVEDLIRNFQASRIPRTEVHVFADVAAHSMLRQLQRTHGAHMIFVYDPHEAESFGLGASRPNVLSEERISSPWLRWMHGRLQQAPVDAVHFACPGFFHDVSGALALARSPIVNEDPINSHFVGARELSSFLTSVGALSVGFSQPNQTSWNLGLRLLADQVAQLRPGPVVLHQNPYTDAPIAPIYGFLFAPAPVALPRIPELALYAHPKFFERFAERDSWVTTSDERFAFGVDAPTPLRSYVMDAAPREVIEPDEPLWRRAMQLATDQAIAEVAISGSGAAHKQSAQVGASNALDVLQSVLGKMS